MKKIFLHLLLALAVLGVILWIVLSMLSRYTRHGEVYIVPDFQGQDHELVIGQYSNLFQFIISDSLYKQNVPLGPVLQQEPPPGSKVKRGRNIYLVTASKQPEKVGMPNLINLSLREAVVSLETAGLNVNEIRMSNHFARYAVISQTFHGADIAPGTLIFRGAAIDLVVGDGGLTQGVPFPMVFGKSSEEARRMIHSVALNVGRESYPVNSDSASALVYRVEPYFKPGSLVRPGTYINLIYQSPNLTNFDKFLKDSLYIEEPDTNNTYIDYEEEDAI